MATEEHGHRACGGAFGMAQTLGSQGAVGEVPLGARMSTGLAFIEQPDNIKEHLVKTLVPE